MLKQTINLELLEEIQDIGKQHVILQRLDDGRKERKPSERKVYEGFVEQSSPVSWGVHCWACAGVLIMGNNINLVL